MQVVQQIDPLHRSDQPNHMHSRMLVRLKPAIAKRSADSVLGLPSSRKRGGHQNELLRDLCHEKPERLEVVGLLEVQQNLERRERERLRGIYHGSSRSMPARGSLEPPLPAERLLARACELSRSKTESPHASFLDELTVSQRAHERFDLSRPELRVQQIDRGNVAERAIWLE